MIRVFVTFMVLLISNPILSQEYSGILKPFKKDSITLKEGDSFVAELVIWPIRFVAEDDFENTFLDKKVLNYFYLAKVLTEGFSVNNPEAYTIRMRLILTKFFDNRNFIILSYKGLNIPVSLKSINPVPLKGRNKKLVLLTQNYMEKTGPKYWPYALVLFLFSTMGWLGVVLLKKRKIEKLAKERKSVWIEKFKSANQRDEFEHIYLKKLEWETLIDALTPEILDFFNTINKYQYKEEWSDDDQIEVSRSFDLIRKIIN